MKQKLFTLLTLALFMSSGVWAYEGQVLFSQNFNSATEVAYEDRGKNALDITTSSGNNIVGTTTTSQFTSIAVAKKGSTGIAINSETGGNDVDASGFFQAYINNTSGYWSICKTTDFSGIAPKAIIISMDIWVNIISGSSNAAGIQFAIGDGFAESLKSSSVQTTSLVHSGFCITAENSPTIAQYNTPGTDIYATALTKSTWLSLTWVINNTGETLTYDNPTGSGTSTLNNDCFDLWLKTQAGEASTYTRVVAGQAATTNTKDLQEMYIGSNGGKKHEFRLDNIVVTDLTPNTSDGATFNASGWNTFASSSKLDLSNITGGTAYVAKEVNGSNKVVLTPCTDIVAAETGIMVKKEGTATKFYIAKTTEEVTSPAADNLLVGVTSATDVPVSTASDYYYVYGWTDPADPGFYKVDGDQPNLPANRAYLHTTKELAARLALDFEEGDVTGIAEISRQQLKANGQFFNLSGQRVSANHKGIVIVNGKKYFNK
ncbi:MAG: hypothetical protein IJS06_03875 [Prevotella sp.]|nr:hypothetical protein [Prevotella sp.]